MAAIELGVMKKKVGPLPLWAWGGLVVGGAVVFLTWRRNQAEAGAEETGVSIKAPETLQPTYVFQDQDQYLVTVPEAPPGGGRPPDAPPPPPPAGPPTGPKVPVGHKLSVPVGANLYDWTASVSQTYSVPYSLGKLRELNPGIDKYIQWEGTTSPKTPVFRRSGGVPPVRIR